MILKLIFTLATLTLSFGNNVANAQIEGRLQDRAYDFCKDRGYSMTDAYMEMKQFNIGICTLPSRDYDESINICYVPAYFFISPNQIIDF